MTDEYRLFVSDDFNRGISIYDCTKAQDNVYHCVNESSPVNAIKTNQSVALTEDGVEEVDIRHIRSKQAKYEQYIYGGSASATKTYVRFSGEYTGREKLASSKSHVKVLVNDTVAIEGDADTVTSEWSWTVLELGNASIVWTDDDLDGLFRDSGVVIGFDDKPITSVNIIRPVYEEEDGMWFEE